MVPQIFVTGRLSPTRPHEVSKAFYRGASLRSCITGRLPQSLPAAPGRLPRPRGAGAPCAGCASAPRRAVNSSSTPRGACSPSAASRHHDPGNRRRRRRNRGGHLPAFLRQGLALRRDSRPAGGRTRHRPGSGVALACRSEPGGGTAHRLSAEPWTTRRANVAGQDQEGGSGPVPVTAPARSRRTRSSCRAPRPSLRRPRRLAPRRRDSTATPTARVRRARHIRRREIVRATPSAHRAPRVVRLILAERHDQHRPAGPKRLAGRADAPLVHRHGRRAA